MKASELTALEVRMHGPMGLHVGGGSSQTSPTAVITATIQPFGVCGIDYLRLSPNLTHLRGSKRLWAKEDLLGWWMGRVASDSLRIHSLKLSVSTEARSPPRSGVQNIHSG